MRLKRTVTYNESSLTLPGPDAATFTFFQQDNQLVKVTIPATSKWMMEYHWHSNATFCELIEFLDEGDYHIFQYPNYHHSYSSVGRWRHQIRTTPGERLLWGVDPHMKHAPGSPDLEVYLQAQGNEDMWRNVISATLDQSIWPELATTPTVIRLSMRIIKWLPFIGVWLWTWINSWVLWLQLLLIFDRFEYRIWCGHIWFISWFPWPISDNPPQWAKQASWDSADWLNRGYTLIARALATTLGLQDCYSEYYICRENKRVAGDDKV